MRLSTCVVAFFLLAGCNHEKVSPASPAPAPSTPMASDAKAPARNLAGDQKMSNTLAMSNDIVQLCGIKPTSSAGAPKFDTDKDQLTDDDHTILQQLATCMLTGPLKGKDVELIGRADPTRDRGVQPGPRLATRPQRQLLSASAGRRSEPSASNQLAAPSTRPAPTKAAGRRIAASTSCSSEAEVLDLVGAGPHCRARRDWNVHETSSCVIARSFGHWGRTVAGPVWSPR